MARRAEVESLNEMAERVILPLLAGTPRVALTGSGDPFGSQHFRWLIRQMTSGRFPGLRIDLQTNGLLLKEFWGELGLDGYAHTLLVSIDAANPATYAVLRGEAASTTYSRTWNSPPSCGEPANCAGCGWISSSRPSTTPRCPMPSA